METSQQPIIAVLPVAALFPHAHNAERAKRYDKTKLQELADSIKANGLAQPVLVTPLVHVPGGQNTYTIVAGERRWRAHQLAGLADITAVVRELTPQQQVELQIIENLQREDVHPLQEAEGYEELTAKHGIKIDDLAARVGKSRAYVFARLKLLDLRPKARAAFYDGKFGSEVALYLARIPVEKLQDEALAAVTNERYQGAPPMSFRDARELIERNFMLTLSSAPFDLKDDTLYPDAGTCTACPKRTGNQAELFADIKGKDVCTDTVCFGKKRAAHFDRVVAQAKADGVTVLEGKKASEVLEVRYGQEQVSKGYTLVDSQSCGHGINGKAASKLLGKDLPPTTLVRTKDGDVVRVAESKLVKRALIDKGVLPEASSRSERSADEMKADLDVKIERAVRVALFRRVRAKIAGKPTLADLQMVAHAFYDDIWDEARKQVFREWFPEAGAKGSDDEKAMHARIDKMDGAELPVFVCDCALAVQLHVNLYDHGPRGRGDVLKEAAARHKVDVDAIRKEVRAEFQGKLDAIKAKGAKAKKAKK